jgi:Spy/CpxP family protein refolding chaperone
MRSSIFAAMTIGLSFIMFIFARGSAQEATPRPERPIAEPRPAAIEHHIYVLDPDLLDSLSLTSQQKEQINKIESDYKREVLPAGSRAQEATCKLDLAIMGDQLDRAKVDRLKQEVVEAEVHINSLRVAVYRQARDILTKDQRARYAQLNRAANAARQASGGGALMPVVSRFIEQVKGLTTDQQKQIDRTLQSYGNQAQAINRREAAADEMLDEAAMAVEFDEAAFVSSQQAHRAAMTDWLNIRVEMLTQVRSALTPAQLASLRKLKPDQCAGL